MATGRAEHKAQRCKGFLRKSLPAKLKQQSSYLGVDSAGDAVVELGVELGKVVGLVDGGLGDVPDGGRLHDVADHELGDGLVLGDDAGAVVATDVAHAAAAVLVAAVVAALHGHLAAGEEEEKVFMRRKCGLFSANKKSQNKG